MSYEIQKALDFNRSTVKEIEEQLKVHESNEPTDDSRLGHWHAVRNKLLHDLSFYQGWVYTLEADVK